MMPEGPAAMPHFILLTALQIWVADTLAVVGLRELIAWPFKLNVVEPSMVLCPCLHLVIIIEHKFTSIVAYTVLANNILFVWCICLAIWKTSFPPWPKPSWLLLQGLVSFEPCRLLLYSFIHLFIPPPGFKSQWWFLKRAQTSVAASSRGSFSFDQTVSVKFVVSAVTPALVAAAADAVFTFNLPTGTG